MKTNHDRGPASREFNGTLDRLVDGELTGDEYRAALASLEDQADGWRQCAMAFLQAQALGAELGELRRNLDLPKESQLAAAGLPAAPSEVSRSGKTRRFDVASLFLIAASFVIAFGLGSVLPSLLGSGKISQEQSVAGNPLATQETAPARHQALRPVGDVRLMMDGPGGEMTDAGQVPLYETEADFEPFLRQDRPGLGPELVELLRQSGHDVVRQQQYVPGQLEDGRQIIVPVEQYRITPVGRRSY